jgi:hypothetical protein
MSEVKEAPTAPVAPKIPPFVADREFLPADLEILETPPSGPPSFNVKCGTTKSYGSSGRK